MDPDFPKLFQDDVEMTARPKYEDLGSEHPKQQLRLKECLRVFERKQAYNRTPIFEDPIERLSDTLDNTISMKNKPRIKTCAQCKQSFDQYAGHYVCIPQEYQARVQQLGEDLELGETAKYIASEKIQWNGMDIDDVEEDDNEERVSVGKCTQLLTHLASIQAPKNRSTNGATE